MFRAPATEKSHRVRLVMMRRLPRIFCSTIHNPDRDFNPVRVALHPDRVSDPCQGFGFLMEPDISVPLLESTPENPSSPY